MIDKRPFSEKILDHFDPVPDWIKALAEECDRTTQSATAKRFGVSGALISNVLKNKYPGSTSDLMEKVRGSLLAEKVICPVAGEISRHTCINNQNLPFAVTNSNRARLFRACRNGCTHSKLESKQ